MMDKKKFKQPPKRFQPRGITVLYEDHDIIVVDKASGLLTVSNEKVRENTAYYWLTHYVRKGNAKSKHRLFIVHRLDKSTSGVLIFAKTEKAKRHLQEEWHGFKKIYHAVVHGEMPQQKGVITSYLTENSVHKMYSTKDPTKGEFASTGYTVLRQSTKYSLLEIELHTGKKNQIRVHMADNDCPVAGDKKYGDGRKGCRRLALHSSSLSVTHPHNKEPMTFTSRMPRMFETMVKEKRDSDK